eukprot:g5132.t1
MGASVCLQRLGDIEAPNKGGEDFLVSSERNIEGWGDDDSHEKDGLTEEQRLRTLELLPRLTSSTTFSGRLESHCKGTESSVRIKSDGKLPSGDLPPILIKPRVGSTVGDTLCEFDITTYDLLNEFELEFRIYHKILMFPRLIQNWSSLRLGRIPTTRTFSSKVVFDRADGTSVPGLEFEAVTSRSFKVKPAIVCIQEWWGVDFAIKAQAEKLRLAGYRVLVPDLYRGELGIEAEEAEHLMTNLDFPGAVQDVEGAAKYLKATGSDTVGVVGFCMGGALSVASSVLVNDIDAAVAYYGICPDGLADPSNCRVPLMGHFGNLDNMEGFSSPTDALELKRKLETSPVAAECVVHMYPNVGHAFANDTEEGIQRKLDLGQGEHDQSACDLAFERSLEFFGQHLLHSKFVP